MNSRNLLYPLLILGLIFSGSLMLSGCFQTDAEIHAETSGHEGHDHAIVEANAEAGHDDHAGEEANAEAGHDDHAGEEANAEAGHDGHDHESGIIHLSQAAIKEADIRIETLALRDISSSLTLTGTVMPHPQGEAFVGSLVEGRVREIHVDVGDQVKAGQPLCILESLAVSEAEASFIIAQAELTFIEGDLERHKIMVAEGIGALKTQLELEAQRASSQCAVTAATRNLQAMGFDDLELEALQQHQRSGGTVVLRSPVAGVVIHQAARKGLLVNSELDLFHIVDLNRLRVKVEVPEQNLAELVPGREVIVVSQISEAQMTKSMIERVGHEINSETRTVPAYLTIGNTDHQFLPGAFTTVRVPLNGSAGPALAVPIDAVFKDAAGDNVLFVEAELGGFELREIETGLCIGGWIQVTSGVSVGDRIVTKGAFAVKSEAAKSEFSSGCSH